MSQEVMLANIDLIQVERIELFGLVAGLGVPRGMLWVGADSVNVQSKCGICHSFVRFLQSLGSVQDRDRMADNSPSSWDLPVKRLLHH
jgi:hypothetical protein